MPFDENPEPEGEGERMYHTEYEVLGNVIFWAMEHGLSARVLQHLFIESCGTECFEAAVRAEIEGAEGV